MKTPWASIARIDIDGKHAGTGFLIGPNHLVTALHVVATPEGRPLGDITLFFNTAAEFDDGSSIVSTTGTLLAELVDESNDFAVLQCASPPPSAKPLVLTDRCTQFRQFSSSGFATQDPTGFTMIGRIGSVNEPSGIGHPTIGLQFEAGSGVKLKGHSGAPVIADGCVVGLLCSAHLNEEEETMGGIVQATYIRHVVDRCNEVFPFPFRYHANIRWPNTGQSKPLLVADRKPEFAAFEKMITGRSQPRVLLLKGESGTGKSLIVKAFESYARGLGVVVASADLKGCPGLEDIWESFYLTAGEGPFRQAVSETGASRFMRIIDDMVTCERPILFSIDNWQEATDGLRKWFEFQLFPQLDRVPNVVVLITGHVVPEPGAAEWGEFVLAHELTLVQSPDDWLEFCQHKWPATKISKDHVVGILYAANQRLKPNEVFNYLLLLHTNLQSSGTVGVAQ
jgi:hypothetical protein